MKFLEARAAKLLAGALVALGIAILCVHRISGAGIEKDAAQVTLMAFNLERHGTISMEESAPYVPSNYREPAPVLVSAAGIALIESVLGKAAGPEDYYHGERVRLLKYQNILWLGLLSLGAFWAIRVLAGSFYLGLLGAILVTYPFWRAQGPLDNLYTEIAAAAVFMFASAALAAAIKGRASVFWGLAGVLFGLATLIKAAELYIFAGTVVTVAYLFFLRRAEFTVRTAISRLALMIAAFGAVVAPWMYRNHVQLGTYGISQRAGVVLMYRAADDTMTPQEYLGTFYVYAPQRLQGIIGKLLGFTPADLQRNGRLQRLNDDESNFAADDLAAERAGEPEKALSYYRQARAERVKTERQYFLAGSPRPEIVADDALKRRATQIILQHPGTHLALTIPLLWRGATLAFPVLLGVIALAARQRRLDLLIFSIPAFGTVMMYALLTHFIARYDLPALTVAIVAFLVTVHSAWKPTTHRSQTPATADARA